jgi:hypothetical protein
MGRIAASVYLPVPEGVPEGVDVEDLLVAAEQDGHLEIALVVPEEEGYAPAGDGR